MGHTPRPVKVGEGIASATIRALQGRVVMSSRLESIVKELARGEVPTVIARISYKSIRGLAEWIPDLEKRIEFFRSYIGGERRRIWIPAFFAPAAVISGAARSTYNNEIGWRVASGEEEAGQGTIATIYGMSIAGAEWNEQSRGLVEARARAVAAAKDMFSRAPEMEVIDNAALPLLANGKGERPRNIDRGLGVEREEEGALFVLEW